MLDVVKFLVKYYINQACEVEADVKIDSFINYVADQKYGALSRIMGECDKLMFFLNIITWPLQLEAFTWKLELFVSRSKF